MTSSSSRYCIIIPNYNHWRSFEFFIDRLLPYQLNIIIVNDGSEAPTSELLARMETIHEQISVINLPYNQGKGGAVLTGLETAGRRGYSHALQIDADGQHNPEDIGLFLELSREYPKSIVNGCPVYDQSVPKARKYGRYVNDFWVYVDTLSFTIKDSMCGLRVYPLQQIGPVISLENLGKRMEFDIEILVRAYWKGIDIRNLSTRVIYPEDGSSHFRYWRDNLLIIKMHIKLFLGMLIRMPILISRKLFPKLKIRHWSSIQERGSLTGMQILIWIYNHLGRIPFLIILHPVLLYFVFTAREASLASRQFLAQVSNYKHTTEQSRPVSVFCVYRHFYHFAISALDKIACWADKIRRSDVIVHHEDAFQEILESGKGAVFIGSHLGNLEVCRALGVKGGRFRINALVFNKHAAKFQELLSRNNPEVNLNLIPVENISADTAIRLKQKVDEGEIVIIVGDRTPVSSTGRVQKATFLGKPAPFSEGPFILASVLGCPVYLLFCIKQEGVYNIYLEHFAESLKYPREVRKKHLMSRIQEYADRLSYYSCKAPYEWFNFFDFWAEAEPDSARDMPGSGDKVDPLSGETQ